MHGAKSYLMDNLEETLRLEIKTDPVAKFWELTIQRRGSVTPKPIMTVILVLIFKFMI